VVSRLEEMAKEGCINISGAVYKDIKNKAGINTKYIGEKKLKNVDDGVKVYEVLCEEEAKATSSEQRATTKSRLPYYITGSLLLLIVVVVLIWFFYPRQQVIVEDAKTGRVDHTSPAFELKRIDFD